MIATQMSMFSTACSSGVTVRASRVSRPGRQSVCSSTPSRPTLSATRVIPASPKGLGSLGLGFQPTSLLQRKTNHALTTTSRRANLHVCAAAAGAAPAKPTNPLSAVLDVFFYALTTIISVPLMCILAVWAPVGMLMNKLSVSKIWNALAKLFWFPIKVPTAETTGAVTEAEVVACQAAWANAIKTISKTYLDKGDYIGAAGEAAGELYGYGHSNVLFKPTKAAEYPFRPTGEEAMSYFVGGDVVDGGYKEDAGFAINGGKGWSDVVFNNHQIDFNGSTAVAMGYYVFTCATTGDKVKVEYTFGYKRNEDGKNRIFLHHSSVPYSA